MAELDARAADQGSLVGVIGAGTMGAGIAQVAVLAGHRVALYDKADGAAATAVAGLSTRLDSLAAKGKIPSEACDAAKARLTVADGLEAFASAFLVIEAVVENLAVKQELLAALEAIVGPACLLATNTSSLSVTAIGAVLDRPERLAGMHFFNPAPLMPLVEVITGLATDPDVADAVARCAEAWGKTTVRCVSTPGFIVNRVARPYYSEALRAYEEGAADFATIDAVLRDSGGFRMGPFELMDMIGLDVNLAVSTSVWEATNYDPRYAPAWTQKEYVAAGRTGRKSKRGFYDYRDGALKAEPVYADDIGEDRALEETESAFLRELFNTPAGARRPNGQLVRRCVGKTATSYGDGTILVDLPLDYETAKVFAIAPAADAVPEDVAAVIGFFQTAGKEVVVVEDVPGMIVTRTVARLVNEAVDAVFRGDADEEDIDLAMTLGVNYPRGPLDWGGDLGMHWVLDVLDSLEDTYRDGRYRASPLLRQLAEADEEADRMLARHARWKSVRAEVATMNAEAERRKAHLPRTGPESIDEAIQRMREAAADPANTGHRFGWIIGGTGAPAPADADTASEVSRPNDASRELTPAPDEPAPPTAAEPPADTTTGKIADPSGAEEPQGDPS